jgi:hypothetical protein
MILKFKFLLELNVRVYFFVGKNRPTKKGGLRLCPFPCAHAPWKVLKVTSVIRRTWLTKRKEKRKCCRRVLAKDLPLFKKVEPLFFMHFEKPFIIRVQRRTNIFRSIT